MLLKISISIISLLVILYILFAYFSQHRPFEIVGSAMAPNYKSGQYYLSDEKVYQNTMPQRGDVIIYQNPRDAFDQHIKRIIGLPGEKIKIMEGHVYINNSLLSEPYLSSSVVTQTFGFIKEGEEITIPADNYFLLGDNRPYSSDSREFGFIPMSKIFGKITTCIKACN